jgi:DNA-binding winged helix-turn-helix (wHTH) protein/preprotein translocase subunit SecG
MEYYFQDYVFKSDQLTLLKQGELVKLRVNEAKLLALLLSNPDSVFSKEDIFSKVWSGKVVTEQAIFQNISRLRNIFDNHAIINHPKKGYQWNIALTPPLDEVKPEVYKDSLFQDASTGKITNKYTVILLSLLLIFTFYFFYSVSNQSSPLNIENTPLTLALLPVNQSAVSTKQVIIDASIIYDTLEDNSSSHQDILITKANEKLSYRQMQANLEFVLLDKLSEHQVDGLLLLDLSSKYGKHALNFSVEVKGYSWRGELLDSSLNSLLKQLKQQLSYLSSMQLLQQANITSKSLNAKLVLLHQQYPKDVIILHYLINNYLQTGYTNEALLLIVRLKKLAEQQNNLTYLGRALLLETSVYLQQSYNEKAGVSLKLASKIFNESSSNEDQIALLNVTTHLAFYEHDYQKLKALNLDIIGLAKSIGDYGKQFSTTLYLSILAQKFENIEDTQKYLQQAKAIYEAEYFAPQAEIKFDFYNFVIAREKKDEAQQIRVLQKIVAESKRNKGIHVFYKNESQAVLAKLFMNKGQFDDALGIFDFESKLTVKEKFLLATIYKRWGKDARAIDYAEQAYNDAIWSAELTTSLDAALLLLELSMSRPGDNTIHQDVYVKYIREHFLPFWLSMNKTRLIEMQFPELIGLTESDN